MWLLGICFWQMGEKMKWLKLIGLINFLESKVQVKSYFYYLLQYLILKVPRYVYTHTEYMIDWIQRLFQSFDSVCWRRNSPNFNLCYVNMYKGTTTPWSFFSFVSLRPFLYWALYTTRTYLWSKWITAAPFKLHREGYIWSLKWAIQKFHYCTNLHYSKNCTNPLASIPIAFLLILLWVSY